MRNSFFVDFLEESFEEFLKKSIESLEGISAGIPSVVVREFLTRSSGEFLENLGGYLVGIDGEITGVIFENY